MEIKLSRGHFCERPVRSCGIAGFVLTEAMYPPNHQLPRHSHERSCFMSVLQGRVTETYARKKLAGKPSTLIFRPSGEVHSDYFHDAGGRVFLIEIEPWWLDRVREHLMIVDDSVGLHCELLTLLSKKLYHEFRAMDELSSLVVEGLMLEMIAELCRYIKRPATRNPPRWVERVRELLHARFAEHLTLTERARTVDVHPVHLGHTFRTHYRCTPGEYVRRLRIEFVCRGLASSNITLTDIALLAGFSDQSHLTRTFKRQTGMTPARYRALHHSP
jgi:AraC family transcriptional regulator